MAYTAPNFTIQNFLGGINEALDENIIKQNECKSMSNFDIERGVLSTSLGVQKYIQNKLDHKIETLIGYYKSNSAELIAISNGAIYRLVNDTFVLIKDGVNSNYFDFVNFNGWEGEVLILGNGVDNTLVYNDVYFRDMKHDGKDTINTDINKSPKMKYIEMHFERIWGAGDKDNPDMLYFSTAKKDGFDYDDWTAPIAEGEANQHGGFINIPTNDGGHIIGIKNIFDDVVVFKKNNVFKVYGTDPGNYTKTQIFSANGGISDRTIEAGNNKAYFMARDGIYMYDGTAVVPIHEKIKDTFSRINKDYMDKSEAVFSNGHYILAVPYENSTVNNLIIDYNTLTGSYKIKQGFIVNCFLKFNDKVLFSDDNGYILTYDTGDTFNGSFINSRYETGYKDLGAQNAVKTTQYIYFIGSGNGSVRFTIQTENDTNKYIEVPLTSTEKPYRKQIKNKGRILNFIIENVNGSYITIKAPTVICDVDYD
jgi:hypothetical protein